MNREMTVKQDSAVITSNHTALGTGWKLGRIKEEIQMIRHIAKAKAHLLLLLFYIWLMLP